MMMLLLLLARKKKGGQQSPTTTTQKQQSRMMDDDDAMLAMLERKLGSKKGKRKIVAGNEFGDDFAALIEDPIGERAVKKKKIISSSTETPPVSEKKKWVPASLLKRRQISPAVSSSDGECRRRVTSAVNKASESNVEGCALDVINCYRSYAASEVNKIVCERIVVCATMRQEKELGPTYAAFVACVHCGSPDQVLGYLVLDALVAAVESGNETAPGFLACLCEIGLLEGLLATSLCEKLIESGRADAAAKVVTIARERLRAENAGRFAKLVANHQAGSLRDSHFGRVIAELISGKQKQRVPEKEKWQRLRASVRRCNRGALPSPLATNKEWKDISKKGWWKITGNTKKSKEASSSRTTKREEGGKVVDIEALAVRHRMTSGPRRSAFVALTGSRDAEDALQRVSRLASNDEDVATVCLHCCLLEDRYNPFYAAFLKLWALDAATRAAHKKSRAFALKLALWNALKSLADYTQRQTANLAKLALSLHHTKTLAITVACSRLSPADALNTHDLQTTTIFLAAVLRGLLDDNKHAIQASHQAASGAEVLLTFLTGRANLLGRPPEERAASAFDNRLKQLQNDLTILAKQDDNADGDNNNDPGGLLLSL